MKTFCSQKNWFLTLSLALLASSYSTTSNAQESKIVETEHKVTTNRTTSNNNWTFFDAPNAPNSNKDCSLRTKCTVRICDETEPKNKNKAQLGILLKGNEDGAVVLKTFPNSAAAEAGLKEGDKILSINNKNTPNTKSLIDVLSKKNVGDKVTIKFVRDGQILSNKVNLKATENNHYLNRRTKFYNYSNSHNSNYNYSPENPCEKLDELAGKPFLGVYLSNPHQENGTGAQITSVIEGTRAAESELSGNDKIFKINKKYINNTQEAIAFIQSKTPGDKVRIHIIRDGQKRIVPATIGSWTDNPREAWKVQQLEERCEEENYAPEEPTQPEDNIRTEPKQSTLPIIEKALTMEVFPNPSSEIVNINFEGKKAPLAISIVSMDGKEMYTNTIEKFDGSYNNQIDVSKYVAGIYFVNFKQGESQLSQKLIVE